MAAQATRHTAVTMTDFHPDGHLDAPANAARYAGLRGWAIWSWRQLTSMRVALLLLLLLAIAAVPGSVLPQRAQSPELVSQFLADHPDLGPWLDRLGFFEVFSSVWFSAIYLLLFISLIGCIVPRVRHHVRALMAPPPKAPARLQRFEVHREMECAGTSEQAIAAVRAQLGRRFRVRLATEPDGGRTLSGERGYLRESGNLVFHLALVIILVAAGLGQMLSYRGQALVVEGATFVNAPVDYDTFTVGAWFDESSLPPFALTVDSVRTQFTDDAEARPESFAANVHVRTGQAVVADQIRVNDPLSAQGTKVYLMGNGYAPHITVRDQAGQVAFSGAVPFLPQDGMYTSRGVIKVPDVSAGEPQLGFLGVLLPTADAEATRSLYPAPNNPVLVLTAYTGDLGLDDGVPQNVYQLDTSQMTPVTQDGKVLTIRIAPGQQATLPGGATISLAADLPRYAALELRHDPGTSWALAAAVLAMVGLAASLFVPRRRLWVRARETTSGLASDGTQVRTVVQAGALARGTDGGLAAELDRALAPLHRVETVKEDADAR